MIYTTKSQVICTFMNKPFKTIFETTVKLHVVWMLISMASCIIVQTMFMQSFFLCIIFRFYIPRKIVQTNDLYQNSISDLTESYNLLKTTIRLIYWKLYNVNTFFVYGFKNGCCFFSLHSIVWYSVFFRRFRSKFDFPSIHSISWKNWFETQLPC